MEDNKYYKVIEYILDHISYILAIVCCGLAPTILLFYIWDYAFFINCELIRLIMLIVSVASIAYSYNMFWAYISELIMVNGKNSDVKIGFVFIVGSGCEALEFITSIIVYYCNSSWNKIFVYVAVVVIIPIIYNFIASRNYRKNEKIMSKIEKNAFEQFIKNGDDEIKELYNKKIEKLIDESDLSNKQVAKEKLMYNKVEG